MSDDWKITLGLISVVLSGGPLALGYILIGNWVGTLLISMGIAMHLGGWVAIFLSLE